MYAIIYLGMRKTAKHDLLRYNPKAYYYVYRSKFHKTVLMAFNIFVIFKPDNFDSKYII